MPNIDSIKAELIDKLWLPKVKEAKVLIYPRRKKNAKMKLFTLTDGINLGEIFKFESENLIQKEDVVAWVENMRKKFRVESESVDCVDGSVYDGSFLASSSQLHNRFPFDIVNLDFNSQEPMQRKGRIEAEVMMIERTIRLQHQTGGHIFVLIYTTILDTFEINGSEVIRVSDAIAVNGWGGLGLNQFANQITDSGQKMCFLQTFIEKLMQKYGYASRGNVTNLNYDNIKGNNKLFSLAAILVPV